MGRLTCNITDDNKRRLDVLKAFATFEGDDVTIRDVINHSIELYFISVYKTYCNQVPSKDYVMKIMEELLPNELYS